MFKKIKQVLDTDTHQGQRVKAWLMVGAGERSVLPKQIAVLGDYSPQSVTHQGIDAAIRCFPSDVAARWVPTDSPEASDTRPFDGVWVAPGTPYRNDDAVYRAITNARLNQQPLLATCGGFQYAVVEFARNVLQRAGAAHAETDPDSSDVVVVPLSCSLVGERRTIHPRPGSKLARICGSEPARRERSTSG